MATVGRGAEQYTVRFPDGLRDRIKDAAAARNRSMNAEIVATLEDAYPENPFDLGSFIKGLSQALNATKDPQEMGRLVAQANLDLEANGIEWRVQSSVSDKGISVQITSVGKLF